MFENPNSNPGEGLPAELIIGQGAPIAVKSWIEVWSKLGEATSGLPWGTYVAWVLLDHGGDQIAASADSRDTYIARYGSGPGKLEALHGF